MRVVTFYSYKGGVGRTLALLNVAASLIARGNRVLIVDFDLEAPGLDKALGLSFVPTRGMVDLIADYLQDGQVPRVEDYVAEARFCTPSPRVHAVRSEDTPARLAEQPLLVLPAGLREDEREYKDKLQGIDFKKLYQEHEGYVFFDDVRQQFGKALARDYVLIDSRTGHTDIGKICTQQLPDHVVALMVPNEQNLAGIEQEVHDIRERHAMCDIDLALTRVPRLDDLEEQLIQFESKVRKSTRVRRVLRVHAAESLALLKDEIYCADDYFAKAQLTKDFQRIVKTILVRNIESREAVLHALEGGMVRVTATVGRKNAAKWVDAVLSSHANDEKVLEELKAALRGAEHAQQRLAVSARLEFITQSSRAAVAARSAREADQAGDAVRARKSAVEALALRAELGCRLVAECFALLCRISPDDADRIARERRPQTIASMLQIDEIVKHEMELLSTLGGAEAVHEAIGARMRFEVIPRDANEIWTVERRPQRRPHRLRLDPRIERPSYLASAALGVATKGHGLWLHEYAFETDDVAPPSWEAFVDLCDPEDGTPAREDFPFWMQYGLAEEKFDEADRLRVKGNVSIQHALFGELAPAKELLAEIDDQLSHGGARRSDPIVNGWRMLCTTLDEFRADLQELIQSREASGCAVGAPPPRDLPRLVPPIGRRRGQESR